MSSDETKERPAYLEVPTIARCAIDGVRSIYGDAFLYTTHGSFEIAKAAIYAWRAANSDPKIEVAQLQKDPDSSGLWIGFKTAEQREEAMKLFVVADRGAA